MRSHLPSAALSCVLLLLSGCVALQRAVVAGFERPRLTFQSWLAQDLDLEGVTIVLRYQVENSNSVAIRVAGARYALDVEAKEMLSGSLPGGLEIPARGSAPLVVTVRFLFMRLPALLEVLTTRDSLSCRIRGSVDIDTPIGRMEIPFQHSERVALPRRSPFGRF
jgi:LEA14-like dessication related protein